MNHLPEVSSFSSLAGSLPAPLYIPNRVTIIFLKGPCLHLQQIFFHSKIASTSYSSGHVTHQCCSPVSREASWTQHSFKLPKPLCLRLLGSGVQFPIPTSWSSSQWREQERIKTQTLYLWYLFDTPLFIYTCHLTLRIRTTQGDYTRNTS